MDRELLELAAKAAGYAIKGEVADVGGSFTQLVVNAGHGASRFRWNPLTDDGDALRLAVKLGISVLYSDFTDEGEARWARGMNRVTEYGPDDPYAATRRAIVRAAAEIGKETKK